MSPEQAMGKTGEGLDGRADLYSLGVVMYEMLTGELPIQAESEVQMLIGQISTAPEPIRARRPELSEGIGAVVMRCLEKDPARRPASGAALIALIENCERGGRGRRCARRNADGGDAAACAGGNGERGSGAPVIPPLGWAAVLVALVVIAIADRRRHLVFRIAAGNTLRGPLRRPCRRRPVAALSEAARHAQPPPPAAPPTAAGSACASRGGEAAGPAARRRPGCPIRRTISSGARRCALGSPTTNQVKDIWRQAKP
jgi:hypothetical protein